MLRRTRAAAAVPGLDAAGRHRRGRLAGADQVRPRRARAAHGDLGQRAAAAGERGDGTSGRRARVACARTGRMGRRGRLRGRAVALAVEVRAGREARHGRLSAGRARRRSVRRQAARTRADSPRRSRVRRRLRPAGVRLRPRAEHRAAEPSRLPDRERRGGGRRAPADEPRRVLRGRRVYGRRRQRAGDGRRRNRRLCGDRADGAIGRARRAARALAGFRRCRTRAFRDPRVDPPACAARYAAVPLRGCAFRCGRAGAGLDGCEAAVALRDGRVPGPRLRCGRAGAVRLDAAGAAYAARARAGRHADARRHGVLRRRVTRRGEAARFAPGRAIHFIFAFSHLRP
ncbi:putative ATP phosphoribosyltransferase regulatory subunit [Burkholderia sp. IT-111MI5]